MECLERCETRTLLRWNPADIVAFDTELAVLCFLYRFARLRIRMRYGFPFFSFDSRLVCFRLRSVLVVVRCRQRYIVVAEAIVGGNSVRDKLLLRARGVDGLMTVTST